MTTIQGKTVVLRRYRREDAEAIFRSTQNDTVRRLTGTQAHITSRVSEIAMWLWPLPG